MQVKRRLAQNREAARKSRARKKEYLKRLELEVRLWLRVAMDRELTNAENLIYARL